MILIDPDNITHETFESIMRIFDSIHDAAAMKDNVTQLSKKHLIHWLDDFNFTIEEIMREMLQ